MTRIILNLLAEPTGDVYRKLIDYAALNCKTALLVVRHTIPLAPQGKEVLDQLAIFLRQQEESSEWPGTNLLDSTALVLRYEFGLECAQVLKRFAGSLYNWQQPDFPEDLCLLRDDGEPWLVSIAHEKDGFLYLSQDEVRNLFNTLPAIESLVNVPE
jgi:hypothetical protein